MGQKKEFHEAVSSVYKVSALKMEKCQIDLGEDSLGDHSHMSV